ncbi:MAG: hypothetical protein J7M14_07375 [Planctomycetes bacterium]|nr:hypothetical protein [Planctomycetota bacterium]
MTKRQLIDEIVVINRSAKPAFLAEFADDDLQDYLDHLQVIRQPRLSANTHRYDMYFRAATDLPDKFDIPDKPAAEPRRSAPAETFAEALSQPIPDASSRQQSHDPASRDSQVRTRIGEDPESWLF